MTLLYEESVDKIDRIFGNIPDFQRALYKIRSLLFILLIILSSNLKNEFSYSITLIWLIFSLSNRLMKALTAAALISCHLLSLKIPSRSPVGFLSFSAAIPRILNKS